jgi:hypothetical protein
MWAASGVRHDPGSIPSVLASWPAPSTRLSPGSCDGNQIKALATAFKFVADERRREY